jgi:hypothetical protein
MMTPVLKTKRKAGDTNGGGDAWGAGAGDAWGSGGDAPAAAPPVVEAAWGADESAGTASGAW